MVNVKKTMPLSPVGSHQWLFSSAMEITLPPIGYVYACKSEAFPNRIKIGKCSDVEKRLSSLNTGCAPSPHVVIISAASFDNVRDESTVLTYFAAFRREGEFFEISEEVVKAYFQMHIVAQHQAEMAHHVTSQWKSPMVPGVPSQVILRESPPGMPSVVPATVNDHLISYFISILINEHDIDEERNIDFDGCRLFERYRYLCTKLHPKGKALCKSSFNLAMAEVKGIRCEKYTKKSYIFINFDEAKRHLESHGEYYEDAKFGP
jgi:hypothetical protein